MEQFIWDVENIAALSCMLPSCILCMCSGIGSLLHAETAALGIAWEAGRVMWEAKGFFMAPASQCGANTSLDSCYFLPLSNCTLENAGLTQSDLDQAPQVGSLGDLVVSDKRVVRWGVAVAMSAPYRLHVPSMLLAPLKQQGVVDNRKALWLWRALGTAYIVRPNARTLSELQSRRHGKLVGHDPRPGCISLYVRHGDKGVENVVFEDAAYEHAIHQLKRSDPRLNKQVFLSTEDPFTVEYFTNASRGLTTTYVQMKRK